MEAAVASYGDSTHHLSIVECDGAGSMSCRMAHIRHGNTSQ